MTYDVYELLDFPNHDRRYELYRQVGFLENDAPVSDNDTTASEESSDHDSLTESVSDDGSHDFDGRRVRDVAEEDIQVHDFDGRGVRDVPEADIQVEDDISTGSTGAVVYGNLPSQENGVYLEGTGTVVEIRTEHEGTLLLHSTTANAQECSEALLHLATKQNEEDDKKRNVKGSQGMQESILNQADKSLDMKMTAPPESLLNEH